MNSITSIRDKSTPVDAGAPCQCPSPTPSQVDWPAIWKPLTLIVAVFLLFFFLPLDGDRFITAVGESLALAQWYAREHVLLCLVPAFFIAGAIAVFVSQGSVMKYLGPGARKVMSYGVASVSGGILAVCSCTVLPLFAGIWKRGAGLGPAVAFLYSGPAVNVLAIILTARILGSELAFARAVGAILFSILIGLIMHLMFRREEAARAAAAIHLPQNDVQRPLWKNLLFFGAMLGLLIFATWSRPESGDSFWHRIYTMKWPLSGIFAAFLGGMLVRWMQVNVYKVVVAGGVVALLALALPSLPLVAFSAGIIAFVILLTTTRGESEAWFLASWDFAKQIAPLLLAGVLVAGLLLGRPGNEGLIPSAWINGLVGDNSLRANLFAAVLGALMYFATLTEIPILQGLMGAGMAKGPALALLLAGPALSLPNMLVIRSVMGTKKTAAFVALVVIMATISGLIYGTIAA